MDANLIQMMERAIKVRPELWSLCYPRIYNEPRLGAYHSPKLLAYRLFEIAAKIQTGHRGTSDIYEFIAASALATYRVPLFFIAPNLMEAINHTATPTDIQWLDMKMPFESGAFMIPKGMVQHPTDGDLVCVGYCRFEEGYERRSPLHTPSVFGLTNGGMMLFALSVKGYFHHWCMPKESFGRTLTLKDIDEYRHDLKTHTSYTALAISEEDDLLMVRIAHCVFSLLLIMADRPEMIETGRLQKRVQKRSDMPKEFWSPNIVGGNYGHKYESGKPVGTHNSPRLHFVRGFWRQQVHGQGRLLRRSKWIEPYIRGTE